MDEAMVPAVLVSMAGFSVAAIGLLGVVSPRRLVAFLSRWTFLTGLPLTIAVRTCFGSLFVFAAPYCRLPELVRAVGVLEWLGVGVLLILGPARLGGFVGWWLERSPSIVRIWCSAALALGVVLIFAGVAPD